MKYFISREINFHCEYYEKIFDVLIDNVEIDCIILKVDDYEYTLYFEKKKKYSTRNTILFKLHDCSSKVGIKTKSKISWLETFKAS